MSPSRSSSAMASFITILLFALIAPSHALFFYLDGHTPKCFYEDLPKDTLVVGHYKFEAYSPQTQSFAPTADLGVFLTVDEVFDNDHRIASQQASYDSSKSASEWYSKFIFTAADPGQHRLCFTASGPASFGAGSWFASSPAIPGAVRLTLDLAIGETSRIESEDKGKLEDITTRVKELNGRLKDIRREQVFQREREAEFRDQSEATNARVVRWTLIQLGVLGITCAWQLSHLRAFFIKQKLT